MVKVMLASKHAKAQIIAPYLTALNYEVEENQAFDTDSLGTFSGEIQRHLSPQQAALHKAKKACELTASDYGMGSEGSFGGGPVPGLVNWNEEVLCFYEAKTERAIYAFAGEATSIKNITADDIQGMATQLDKYPKQHWIIRLDNQLVKGLTADDLLSMSEQQKLRFPLTLEPDLRAMYCPERQKVIAKAAEDLVRRLSAKCSNCDTNDFVVNKIESGLLCALCGLPTKQTKNKIKICSACGYTETIPADKQQADPTFCDFCNP